MLAQRFLAPDCTCILIDSAIVIVYVTVYITLCIFICFLLYVNFSLLCFNVCMLSINT